MDSDWHGAETFEASGCVGCQMQKPVSKDERAAIQKQVEKFNEQLALDPDDDFERYILLDLDDETLIEDAFFKRQGAWRPLTEAFRKRWGKRSELMDKISLAQVGEKSNYAIYSFEKPFWFEYECDPQDTATAENPEGYGLGFEFDMTKEEAIEKARQIHKETKGAITMYNNARKRSGGGSTRIHPKFWATPEMMEEQKEYYKREDMEWPTGDWIWEDKDEIFNVEFNEWADQELMSHGKDISFKDWAQDEGMKHGNTEITEWAQHEDESHDARYGAESETLTPYDFNTTASRRFGEQDGKVWTHADNWKVKPNGEDNLWLYDKITKWCNYWEGKGYDFVVKSVNGKIVGVIPSNQMLKSLKYGLRPYRVGNDFVKERSYVKITIEDEDLNIHSERMKFVGAPSNDITFRFVTTTRGLSVYGAETYEDSWEKGVIRLAISSGCFSDEYAEWVERQIDGPNATFHNPRYKKIIDKRWGLSAETFNADVKMDDRAWVAYYEYDFMNVRPENPENITGDSKMVSFRDYRKELYGVYLTTQEAKKAFNLLKGSVLGHGDWKDGQYQQVINGYKQIYGGKKTIPMQMKFQYVPIRRFGYNTAMHTKTKNAETSGQWEIGEQLEEAQMNAEGGGRIDHEGGRMVAIDEVITVDYTWRTDPDDAEVDDYTVNQEVEGKIEREMHEGDSGYGYAYAYDDEMNTVDVSYNWDKTIEEGGEEIIKSWAETDESFEVCQDSHLDGIDFLEWSEEAEGPDCYITGLPNPEGDIEGEDNICEPCRSKWIYEDGPEGEGYYRASVYYDAEDQNKDLLKWMEDYLWDNDKKGYQDYHAHRKSLGLSAEERKKRSSLLSEPFEGTSLDSGDWKGIVAGFGIGLLGLFGYSKLRK